MLLNAAQCCSMQPGWRYISWFFAHFSFPMVLPTELSLVGQVAEHISNNVSFTSCLTSLAILVGGRYGFSFLWWFVTGACFVGTSVTWYVRNVVLEDATVRIAGFLAAVANRYRGDDGAAGNIQAIAGVAAGNIQAVVAAVPAEVLPPLPNVAQPIFEGQAHHGQLHHPGGAGAMAGGVAAAGVVAGGAAHRHVPGYVEGRTFNPVSIRKQRFCEHHKIMGGKKCPWFGKWMNVNFEEFTLCKTHARTLDDFEPEEMTDSETTVGLEESSDSSSSS